MIKKNMHNISRYFHASLKDFDIIIRYLTRYEEIRSLRNMKEIFHLLWFRIYKTRYTREGWPSGLFGIFVR